MKLNIAGGKRIGGIWTTWCPRCDAVSTKELSACVWCALISTLGDANRKMNRERGEVA